MRIWLLIASAGLSFAFLALMLGPLERAFPARAQRFFRPRWWTDLAFFLGQYLVWGGAVLAVLHLFRGWLDGIVPAGFRAAVAAQPWWLQAVEVILLSDLLIYWGHRLQHRVDFLWRFHSIHHSAEHLDWLRQSSLVAASAALCSFVVSDCIVPFSYGGGSSNRHTVFRSREASHNSWPLAEAKQDQR